MSAAGLIAGLDLAVWLYLLLGRGRYWHTDCPEDYILLPPLRGKVGMGGAPVALPESVATPHLNPPPQGGRRFEEWPDICAVIPARNEAVMLDKTLPTLLAADYPGTLKMVLVDDRSEDETAAIAARIADNAKATDRVKIVSGHARPGWKGKVAAMQCGLDCIAEAGTDPRYILFTDADIAYDRDAVRKLVLRAERDGNVLTSLMVKLNCRSFAERWLIPAFVYFFQLLYPFDRVNDPKNRTAAAAGGCMLVRYDALKLAGGLAPIRGALIDDCALGRLMKGQGPVALGLTRSVHSLREYPQGSDIRAMVSRSAYDQLDYSPLNLLGATVGMALLYLAPVLLTLFGSGRHQVLGAASWLIMSVTFLPMVRFYGRPISACFALPAVALAYIGFTLDSALAYWRGKGGLWKGRVQAGAEGA